VPEDFILAIYLGYKVAVARLGWPVCYPSGHHYRAICLDLRALHLALLPSQAMHL